MAIGVKVMNRPLERVSYVRATLKGMVTTLKHLVDPHKVTMQYPETKWELSPRWRGTHRMLTTEDGKAKCIMRTPNSTVHRSSMIWSDSWRKRIR